MKKATRGKRGVRAEDGDGNRPANNSKKRGEEMENMQWRKGQKKVIKNRTIKIERIYKKTQ